MTTAKLYVLNANSPGRAAVLANAKTALERLPPDRAYKVEITEYRKPRSLDQCAAMFGVAYAVLMDFIGLRGEADRLKLHEDFCCGYFGEVATPFGGRKPKRTTTTDESGKRDVIDTAKMADFYSYIQQVGAGIGCEIPDPDPTKGRKFPHRSEAA